MQIPFPNEQRDIIKNIEKEPFAIGEKVCPILSSWFHNWKQYVNYDNDIEPTPTPMGPIDNSKIITDGRLNQNLIEDFNYNLLHKESYNYLQNWYTGGPTIDIDVIPNSKGKPVVVTRFINLKINYNHSEKPLEVHKYMKISEIHKSARELFEIPSDKTTRLVDFYNSIVGNVLDDEIFIENYQIIEGEEILLDYQKVDQSKSWYSTQLKSYHPNKNGSLSSSSLTYSDKSCPGLVGFTNLGNTCYFNSGVQCLIHTVPLVSKFVNDDQWQDELNLTNKIGLKGELAKSFASLASNVWSGKIATISPLNLKQMIGKYRDCFSGFDQQDSHELIYAMLDAIHEDMNRCIEKPLIEPVEGDGTDDDEKAAEAWKRYKMINDSIIVDLFDGLFRSHLSCPKCKSPTVVFDPFRSITVPIEKPHTKVLRVNYIPLDFFEPKKTFKVEIQTQGSTDFNDFASAEISRLIGKTVKVKLGVQLTKGYPLLWGFKAICVPKATVYAFEVPDRNCDDDLSLFMACVIEVKPKLNTNGVANFLNKMKSPFLIEVTDLPDNFDENEGKQLFEKKVEEKLSQLWPTSQNKKEGEKVQKINQIIKKKIDFNPPDGFTFSEPSQKVLCRLIKNESYYNVSGKEGPKTNIKAPCNGNKNFVSGQSIIHLNDEHPNFSVAPILRTISLTTENKIDESDTMTLSKCFQYFSMADFLDERNQWRCPKCKELVCAKKELSIWQLPQILIIQLKRFSGTGFAIKKLDNSVEFPEILDMKDLVVGPQKNEAEIKYRLYAVCIQHGTLNFGHYTAEARVRDPKDPGDDKGWYKFNDSVVSKSSEADAHSPAAYVLFYERINNK